MFSRFDRIPACERQTDIMRQHSPRYAYASRGKNSAFGDVQLPLVVPILYFLIAALLVAVPLITKPKDSATGLAMMLGTGVAYYLLVITWTSKPAVLVNTMSKSKSYHLFTIYFKYNTYNYLRIGPVSYHVLTLLHAGATLWRKRYYAGCVRITIIVRNKCQKPRFIRELMATDTSKTAKITTK